MKTNGKTHVRKGFLCRRRGVGLPMVLMIVLFGGALIAFIFDAVTQFNFITVEQQKTYTEHLSVTDMIEWAKGTISHYNTNNTSALQRADRDADVRSAADLRITELNLSRDEAVPNRDERITLQVFDMAYGHEQIPTSGIDAFTLAGIPTPLVLSTESTSRSDTFMDNEGFAVTTQVAYDDFPPSISRFDSDKFGAYLIRVELFDAPHGVKSSRPKRVAEQAFFQITQ